MEIRSFDQWLDTLATALAKGKAAGLSGEQITDSAVMLGDYLARNVQPDIPENKLLKSLWEIGTDEEKQALANMMVKLVQSRTRH
ncbi:MAG: DUF3243 domain-containing protein [Thermacetogeniaceae bacterium]